MSFILLLMSVTIYIGCIFVVGRILKTIFPSKDVLTATFLLGATIAVIIQLVIIFNGKTIVQENSYDLIPNNNRYITAHIDSETEILMLTYKTQLGENTIMWNNLHMRLVPNSSPKIIMAQENFILLGVFKVDSEHKTVLLLSDWKDIHFEPA